jgi:CIC family chloride channel protein
LLVALVLLKPLVTVLYLGSGANGGLFTPVMAPGAVHDPVDALNA